MLIAACCPGGRLAADITVSTPMDTVDENAKAISDTFDVYYNDNHGHKQQISVSVTYDKNDSKFIKAQKLSDAINAQLPGYTKRDPGSPKVKSANVALTGIDLHTNNSHENEDNVHAYAPAGNAIKAMIDYQFNPTGLNFSGGVSSFASSISFSSPVFGNVLTESSLTFGALSSQTTDGITLDTYNQLLSGLPSVLKSNLSLDLSQDLITFTFPAQATDADVSNYSSDTGTAQGLGLLQAGAAAPEPSTLVMLLVCATSMLAYCWLRGPSSQRRWFTAGLDPFRPEVA
jgi:hypothetical protein